MVRGPCVHTHMYVYAIKYKCKRPSKGLRIATGNGIIEWRVFFFFTPEPVLRIYSSGHSLAVSKVVSTSRDRGETLTGEMAQDSIDLLSDPSSQLDMINFLSLEETISETQKTMSENNFKAHGIVKTKLPHGSHKLVAKKGSKDRRSRLLQNLNEKSNEGKTRNSGSLEIISLDELAWHDSRDDCWIAVYDYVYNCTEFLEIHPGGLDVILEYAGRDATIAFIGTGHSNHANKLLQNYLIGELPVEERLFRKTDGIKIVQL